MTKNGPKFDQNLTKKLQFPFQNFQISTETEILEKIKRQRGPTIPTLERGKKP